MKSAATRYVKEFFVAFAEKRFSRTHRPFNYIAYSPNGCKEARDICQICQISLADVATSGWWVLLGVLGVLGVFGDFQVGCN